MDDGRKRELEDKVVAGERLTQQDGEDLYDSDDLAWLGGLAHLVRTRKNGDRVFFNVNRHLNLTNVCSATCAYCSFQRKPGDKDAYTMRIEEAVRLAEPGEVVGVVQRDAVVVGEALAREDLRFELVLQAGIHDAQATCG